MNRKTRIVFIVTLALVIGMVVLAAYTKSAYAQTATPTNTPLPAPDLVIQKAHTGAPPDNRFIVGTNGTYTLTVTNQGNAPANTITVTDPLPTGLGFISGNGAGWLCSNVGQNVTCTNAGPINPGASSTITLTVSVSGSAVPSVTNTAHVSTTTAESNTTNNDTSDLTVVHGAPDMTITKFHTGNFTVGVNGTFTIRVQNVGTDANTGTITVSDTLNADLQFVSGTGSGWNNCTASGQVVTCTNTNSFPAFSSIPDITLTVKPLSAVTNATNCASVSTPGDPNSTNNTTSPCDTYTTNAQPDLGITKSHAPEPFIVNSAATYTLTVTNQPGAGPTTGQTTVTDTLPAGITFQSGGGDGFTCTASGQVVTCTKTLIIAANETDVITINIVPTASAATTVTNQASVSTPNDPNTANNLSNIDTANIAHVDLAITKSHTGNFSVGTNGTFTIGVQNVATGPGAVGTGTATVTVTDTLPTGMSFVSGGGSGFTCSGTTTVTCTSTTNIAPGAPAVTFPINVSVGTTAQASSTNTAVVSVPGDTPSDPSGANNTFPDTVTVLRPDLTISKTHPPSFAVGVANDYTITVTNSGTGNTTGTITVTDTLPASFTFNSATGSGWACTNSSGTVTCTTAATATANSSLPPITINVTPTSQGTFTNTATVNNATDVNTGNNTATDPTTVGAAPPPDLAISKAHAPDPMVVGTAGTITISVVNVGVGSTVAGQWTHVVDTVPSAFTLTAASGGSGTGWACSKSGQTVTCDRNDALPGGNTPVPDITIPVTPNTNLGSPFTNQATVYNPGDTNSGNNTATDSIPVNPANAPDLTITKSHTQNFVVGQNGTYTIRVQNLGAQAVAGGSTITVTENLPPSFDLVSAGGGASGWTCTNAGPATHPVASFTCNFTLAAPLGTNAFVPNDLPVVVTPTTVTGSPFNNNVVVSPAAGETNNGNNSANDSTTVTAAAAPDLKITKSHIGNFTAGQPATFTISVQNIGTQDTSGTITVTDNMPTGLTYVSGTGTTWTCNSAPATTMSCSSSTAFVAGGPAQTITLTVNVASSAPSSISNTASVSAPPGDSNTANNTSTDTVTVNGIVDLAITKSHAANFQVGVNGVYTLSVQNVGSQASSGTTTVTDTLPNGLVPLSANGTGWNCTIAGQNVNCSRSTAISGGQTTSITLTVQVTAAAGSATQPLLNTATLANASDSNGANNISTDPTFVTPPNTPDLAISKSHTGNFVIGQNATYVLTVSNVGTGATSSTTVVSDTLPTGLTFVAGGGGGFSCLASGQLVTCQNPNAIAAGANLQITLTVAVSPSLTAGTTLNNTASVNVPTGDPNTANNTSNTDTVTVQTAPPVSATNSTINAFPTTVLADGFQTTTITVTLRDTTGVATPNKQVQLTTDTGMPPGLSISNGGVGTTNSSGVVTFTATSTVAQTVNFRANVGAPDNVTITNGTRTVTFVSPTGISPTNSTVTASPTTVLANGSDFSTITVNIRNNSNQPVAGASVTLFANPTGATATPGTTLTTDINGNAAFQVRNTNVQNVTFTVQATFGAQTVTLNQQPVVNFTSTATATPTGTSGGAVDGSKSSFVSSHISIPADNITTATFTATLRNSSGGAVTGVTVTVSCNPTLTGMTITPNNNGVSDSNGVATFTVRSVTQGGPVTCTAVAGGVTISQTAQISFTAPGTAPVVNPNLTLTPGTPGTGTPGAQGVALLAAPSNGPNIGIVRAFRLRVRTGPGLRYPVIGLLKLGTRVILLARIPRGTWFMIQLENGETGWVSSGYIRVARLAFRHLPIVDPRTLPPPGAIPAVVPTPTPTKTP
jgi:uncharacterized repeat protein (TIGR01451 family)